MASLSVPELKQQLAAHQDVLLAIGSNFQNIEERLLALEQRRSSRVTVAQEASSQSEAQQDAGSETASSPSLLEAGSEAATEAPAKSSFSLEALQAEVEVLRSSHPAYVTNIGSLKVPGLVCGSKKELLRVNDGMWDLTLTVSGHEKNPAYDAPFRIGLRFDRSWPEVPPDVRFNCVIHHALLDDTQEMLPPFYQTLPRDADNKYTLAIIVEAIHAFLIDPIERWGIDRKTAPARLLMALRQNEHENLERLDVIRKYSTMVLHPELFGPSPKMCEEWFDPAFWAAHQAGTPDAWRALLNEELSGEVFSFPLFTLEFCDLLLAEIFNFYESKLPAKRPNSMNNYGIILNAIGLEPFITELQRMFQPIGEVFFPGAGDVWDGHHCFIVRYREGEDLGLDVHTDDSDVTFNCCLGLDFDGAGLQFCGLMGSANHRRHSYAYHHKKGSAVCHLGRKRHGADDITRGERLNLILWNHSSTYRSSKEYNDPDYEKEAGPPDQVCLSYTHDRDYGIYKEYPAGKENFQGRGWCPPQPFEYDGFQAERR